MGATHTAALPQPSPVRRSLVFRQARLSELAKLKEIYDASWCRPDMLKRMDIARDAVIDAAMANLAISESQLAAQIERFPEGQIVACYEGSDVPIAMINILVRVFNGIRDIYGGYDPFTGNRTWSTHVPVEQAIRIAKETAKIAVACCMSIVVDPAVQNGGVALKVLNHAIEFGEAAGLVVMPYSAPRGFAEYKSTSLHARMGDADCSYLHVTKPSRMDYETYVRRLTAFNEGRGGKFYRQALAVLNETEFALHNSVEDRTGLVPLWDFTRWKDSMGRVFRMIEGRPPTVEDYAIMTGRSFVDSVIDMHVKNGARFLRDRDGSIWRLEASRPEDLQAGGWNIPLTYTPHPALLGPGFEWMRNGSQ